VSRPVFRHVVPPGASVSLAELVARLVPELRGAEGAAGSEALADGRVFVDARRVTDAQALVPAGAVVELYARRDAVEGVAILATHGGLVFAAKPPGIATEPDHAGVDDSLTSQVERLLGAARGELHAVSRLDVGVSGVVTLARDPIARDLALGLRASGGFERRYLALSAGAPEPEHGTWSGSIGRARDGRRRTGGAGAKDAATRYTTVARAMQGSAPGAPNAALLVLSPVTGRTHQLRVHAAAAGVPLLGDRAYGGTTRVRLPGGRVGGVPRPALHALWVELRFSAGPVRVACPVADDFARLWSDLGGDPAALERAWDAPLDGGA
jgi:23S rRNA pseudouridine1911/1915/1917 synthase